MNSESKADIRNKGSLVNGHSVWSGHFSYCVCFYHVGNLPAHLSSQVDHCSYEYCIGSCDLGTSGSLNDY